MKKSVPVLVDNIGESYMFQGPFSKIVAMLNSYLEEHPDAYIERRVQDYADDYDFCVYYNREETDEEYAKRKAAEIEEANENRLKMELKIAQIQKEAAAFGICVTMEK